MTSYPIHARLIAIYPRELFMRNYFVIGIVFLALTGCVTPRTELPDTSPVTPTAPIVPPEIDTFVDPVDDPFGSLAGWQRADLEAGLSALRRSCALFSEQDETTLLSTAAPWAGRVADWSPICSALSIVADPGTTKTVLEALLVPIEIIDPEGRSRFTGYFEPTYPARRTAEYPFTEPAAAVPDDLVARSGDVFQRLSNGGMRPYPARAEITRNGVVPLAYMRPSDLFFLQIQGSGRLEMPDGEVLRIAFAAHNGHPFRSTANWLMDRGWIARHQASMTGISRWMQQAPESRMRAAMNSNPRYIFFRVDRETPANLGPRGSLGVPLTPLGSMAVDNEYLAPGIPLFVKTTAPGLNGDWSGFLVAQDTGNAIKGPVRGDIYFGTGVAAGQRAETVNAPGRLWVLLPRGLAADIMGQQAPRLDVATGRPQRLP